MNTSNFEVKNNVLIVSSDQINKDIQILFIDYEDSSYQIRINSLKSLFKEIVESKNLSLETEVLDSSKKFGQIYGLFEITSEIFYIFSVNYKQIQNLAKAKNLAEQSVFFIQNSNNSSRNLPKYLIFLSSILSCQKFFEISLKNLKIARKKLKIILGSQPQSDPELFQMLIICIYNIATEEEFLNNSNKSLKNYQKCMDLILKYKPNLNPNLIQKISQGFSRLSKANKPILANHKLNAGLSSSNHFRHKTLTIKSKKLLMPIKKINSKKKNLSQDIQNLSKQLIQKQLSIRSGKSPKIIKPPRKDIQTNLNTISASIQYGQINKKKTLELSQSPDTSPKIEKLSRKPNLSISDTTSLAYTPAVQEEEKDQICDYYENEDEDELDFKSKLSKSIHSALSRTISLNVNRDEKISDNERVGLEYRNSSELEQLEKINLLNCVLVDEIEIEAVFYKSYFQLIEGRKLLVTCKRSSEEFRGIFEILGNMSVFEFINDHVKKQVTIQNQTLILSNQITKLLIQGQIDLENSLGPFSIQISRNWPRWSIEVKIDSILQTFEIPEILNGTNHTDHIFLLKNPSILISFFTIIQNRIVLTVPSPFHPVILFEDAIRIENEPNEIKIQINKINYMSARGQANSLTLAYLIKSPDLEYFPYVIHPGKLMELLGRFKQLSDFETVNVLKSFLMIFEGHFEINREKIRLMISNEKELEDKKIKIIQEKRKQDIISVEKIVISNNSTDKDFEEGKRNDNRKKSIVTITDSNKIFLSGKSTGLKNFNQRIFMRYSVFEFGQVFQIYLKYASENVISFYISKGISNDDIRKFTVDLKYINETLGFDSKNIFYISWFLIRYHLVIKSIDVCYIDISNDLRVPLNSSEKIRRLIRRYFSSKLYKKLLNRLVAKKKIKLEGVIYTALVYLNQEQNQIDCLELNESFIKKTQNSSFDNKLYLRLVKKPDLKDSKIIYKTVEVLCLNMDFSNLIRDGMFRSADHFFSNFGELQIKILNRGSSRKLVCSERYLIE